MKLSLLFLLFVQGVPVHAKVSAIDFLDGVDHRIEKLEFQVLNSVTKEEAAQIYKGRWRMVYHCNGTPIHGKFTSPTKLFGFGGLGLAYLEYGEKRVKTRESVLAGKAKLHHNVEYRVDNVDNGIVIVHSWEKWEQYEHKERLLTIIPTREVGIETIELDGQGESYGTCEDGSPVRPLMIKVDPVTS